MGRHCEKRRGTGAEYKFEPETLQINEEAPVQIDEPERVQKDEFNEVPVEENVRRGLPAWVFITIAILSVALVRFLFFVKSLYKRFLAHHDTTPAEDSNSKEEMSIHISPYVNDNVSALEMH